MKAFKAIIISLRLSLLLLIIIALSGCNDNDETPIPADEGLPKLWVKQLSAEIYYGSPALSSDEKTLYIGTSKWISVESNTHNEFVALDVGTGNLIWRIDLGKNQVRSSPTVAPDQSLYFTVENYDSQSGMHRGNDLWHVSALGNVLWKFNINPSKFTMEIGQSSAAIGADGTVYIAGDKLYAINPDGTERWSYGPPFPGELLTNAPVIGSDGTVYFVFHNFPLTAFNPQTGEILWTRKLGVDDHCMASPAIDTDGTLYIASLPGILYAVSSTGQINWVFELASIGYSGNFKSSPAIDRDGTLYIGINVGDPSSALLAINSNGMLKWKFEPSDLPSNIPSDHFDIYSSPAIGANRIIYFGQEFGRVYGLNASDGSPISITKVNSGITWSSPALDSEGRLFITDLSGSVFALQSTSLGLDNQAQWPKYRFDNQNRGRLTVH